MTSGAAALRGDGGKDSPGYRASDTIHTSTPGPKREGSVLNKGIWLLGFSALPLVFWEWG